MAQNEAVLFIISMAIAATTFISWPKTGQRIFCANINCPDAAAIDTYTKFR
jgi:hypothetical protein